ncbi:MAG: peptidoglycan-binding domain-containing protein [Clostridia bacterium]
MKKPVSYALVAVLLLSVLVGGPHIGPYGVDAVSAATGEGTAPGQTSTKAQTTYSTATEVTRLLVDGSFGNEVWLLQTLLNNNGYKLKVDGFFGKGTLEAVKDYQSKNGLKADGIVGPKTVALLKPVTAAPVAPEKPVTEVKPAVDAVTTASIVDKEAAFEKGISKDGTWIIAALNNLTFSKPLVLEGEFKNTKTPPVSIRKIALYTQDDKRNVLARFTLTAPKLTIKSPDANISKGTFKGDLYISAKNFKLIDAKVDGNVYFTTQEAKDTFTKDATSSITGKQILFDVDAVSTATPTQVQDVAAFEKAISKDGYWIIVPILDLTTDKNLVVEGTFHDKNDPAKALKRKIGLYTHNDPLDKKKATHSFTLTAPSLTIKSPFATLQYGFFVGDIYVEANNFSLVNNKVTGNIYFATQEAKDTFTMDAGSSVSGVQAIKTK